MKGKITILLTLLLALSCSVFSQSNNQLESNFKNPPSEAKARTWWHWMNGNVTKAGITADLEAMKQVGIQEVQLFNTNVAVPLGSASYLSDEWLDLFEFAMLEAQRLELEMAFHNCPGWSSSGGPWIKPEHAMQRLVYTEQIVSGGQDFCGQLAQPKTKLNYYKDIVVLAFPQPQHSQRIDHLDYKSLSTKVRNHLAPDAKLIPAEAIIDTATIIDLTDKMTADGRLEWTVPDGQWVVLRLGHTPTGKNNVSAPTGAVGLECDKMSREAVDVFWEGGISPIISKLDTLVGTVLKNCIIDSYEVGCTNWTTGFDDAFAQMRGYDMASFLPVLAGYYVQSGEVSERFLWDFRRTIGDLIAENYYAYFRDKCHEHNMTFSLEPYWGPFDNMQIGATGDIVMSEFWSGELAFFDSPKFVASIAKLNGNTIVGAEAFTDMGGWKHQPSDFKAIGDMAWAQGINRFIFHTYVHQPWNVAPGLALGPFGVDFNRLNTWWNQSGVFLDYLARGQYLLQAGKAYADILVFTGESSPNDGLLMPEIKSNGYDYDLIGRNKLDVLTVKDGLICTPYGAQYKALVLPTSTWMTPETLQIFEALAKDGATILGSQVEKSPSLNNYPHCDKQVAAISAQLYKDKLISEGTVLAYLKTNGVQPDFEVEQGGKDDVVFLHRTLDDADVYFVANTRKEQRELKCRFRIADKQPELWNAETGEISNATVWQDNGGGTTSVMMPLGQEESVFVVFRNAVSSKKHLVSATMNCEAPTQQPLLDLKVINAEYGTFLPDGLVDVTGIVTNAVHDNGLSITASRQLCDCDPAPGYKKELRLEYQLGEQVYMLQAREKEPLIIAPSDKGELKITKAFFGKYEGGAVGLPAANTVYDVTAQVQAKINSGELSFAVDNSLVEAWDDDVKRALRVVYSANGEEKTVTIADGDMLNLAQATSVSRVATREGKDVWISPYAGELTYTMDGGQSKSASIESVPEPILLSNDWQVSFPMQNGEAIDTVFGELNSWSLSANEAVRHFSGTASYTHAFKVSKKTIKAGHDLELDLGAVYVVAEVFLNGESMGVLWRAPYRVNITDKVKAGTNTLEVKVTNLWINRLIGDEYIARDFEAQGPKVKQWPEWLLQGDERPSSRQTLASFRHWRKNSQLQTSGLLGPVKVVTSAVVELK